MDSQRNALIPEPLVVLELLSDDWYGLWEVYWQLDCNAYTTREVLKKLLKKGLIEAAEMDGNRINKVETANAISVFESETAFETQDPTRKHWVVGITEDGMKKYRREWRGKA